MTFLYRSVLLKNATRLRRAHRTFSSNIVEGPGLWQQYNILLEKQPLLTKCVTSGFLSITADIICQKWFSADTTGGSSIDWWRTVKFTLLGTMYTGPVLHSWYGLLATRIPGTGAVAALKRLAFDQIVFAPTYICGFYSLALLLDGTPELILDKLKADLTSTIVANFSVWVPCQFINFRFVPPHLQVLWSNMVGFFWNIYLSKLTYQDCSEQTAAVTASSTANSDSSTSPEDDSK